MFLIVMYLYCQGETSSDSTTSTILPTLPPSKYKLVEMNDTLPFFKLATIEGHKPHADGDRAQQRIMKNLRLQDKCRRDPSILVADVGAFLGKYDTSSNL